MTRLRTTILAISMSVWATAAVATLPSSGYADLVDRVSPTVVFISSTHKISQSGMSMHGSDDDPHVVPRGPPGESYLKQFHERTPRQQGLTLALGSGFIISAAGYIVTNNHVIQGANKVRVKLQDGRKFDAEVVGTDPMTDLALLKISAEKPLPFVNFGDSTKARVGNIVLAVGNPFGLGGTVTAGIVSALHRDLGAGPYDDFLQTDAPINQGNSGGPLFNTQGDVIGVNSAIFSLTGGSVGIGFAIPASLAKGIVTQLKDHGNVERGWLGVVAQLVSPVIAEAIGLKTGQGAIISEVTANSPAAESDLRPGDVILGFNGMFVKTPRDLPRLIAGMRFGETASFEIWRNGKKKAVPVVIGQLKLERVGPARLSRVIPGTVVSKALGAGLTALKPEFKALLNLPADAEGVVVAQINPKGRAAAAGMRSGDVIERVGSLLITHPKDVAAAFAQPNGNAVLLLINRAGNKFYIGVEADE